LRVRRPGAESSRYVAIPTKIATGLRSESLRLVLPIDRRVAAGYLGYCPECMRTEEVQLPPVAAAVHSD